MHFFDHPHPEYRIVGHAFKYGDTTREIRLRFLKPHQRIYSVPDDAHTFKAKVANGEAYVGEFPANIDGGDIVVKSADLTSLAPDEYRMEILEEYTDDNGKKQTRIYPSPHMYVHFKVEESVANASDEYVKKVTFQDVVDEAVKQAGMNLEITAKSVASNEEASVTQMYSNGKSHAEFLIPRGKNGQTWQPYINEDGNWHVKLIQEGELDGTRN